MVLRLKEISVDLANKIEKRVKSEIDYAFLLIYVLVNVCMKEVF